MERASDEARRRLNSALGLLEAADRDLSAAEAELPKLEQDAAVTLRRELGSVLRRARNLATFARGVRRG